MVASFYVCQPNHSYSRLHSDLTRANVVTDVLHYVRVWSELLNTLQYYS